LNLSSLDVDFNAPGIQVLEGSTAPVHVSVTDDVQVRHVELLLNERVVASDISFPFEFSVQLPFTTTVSSTATLRARATDTGGNATLSDPVVLNLVPDTFPPTILAANPDDATRHFAGMRTLSIQFSEAMDASQLNASNIRLAPVGNLAATIVPTDVRIKRDGREVQLTYPPLAQGDYQVTLAANQLRDRVGNTLGAGNVQWQFEVLENRDPGQTLATALDLGTLGPRLTFQDFFGVGELGEADPEDIFVFTLAEA
ncbi:MAG: Ig-like domain-containing protein, partial [Planctomycetales bacterium]|nr:Ig-like domain-containing protein [Planctomycetales bacterium]